MDYIKSGKIPLSSVFLLYLSINMRARENFRTKKPCEISQGASFFNLFRFVNRNLFIVFALSFKTDDAVFQCVKRIVAADTYVGAGMDFRTALAHKNVACKHKLSVGTLGTEAFCRAVTSVVRTTRTFFMSK